MRSHHILDPRSGFSAPFLASATVIAPSCAQADTLATALMVMKPEDGLKFWGSPWTPKFFDWAFMRQPGEEMRKVWAQIPAQLRNIMIVAFLP
jgi:hypothetical protein